MGHLRDPSSGMTSVSIGIDEIVALCINNADDFQKRCPAQFKALLDKITDAERNQIRSMLDDFEEKAHRDVQPNWSANT